MDYKALLLEILGLPPEATDEAIQAAIDGLMSNEEATEMENCNKRLDNENRTLRERLANRDLDDLGIIDATERATAAALLNAAPDRDAALALLKNRVTTTPTSRTPMTNRSTAGVPKTEGDEAQARAEVAKAARITNRAKQIQKDQKVSWPAAFVKAQAEFEG